MLNTVSSDDPMAVDCAVDQKQINRFAGLLEKKQGAADTTFTLVLPDGSVYPEAGVLSVVDRAVDSQTGTIRVRMVFPNPRNVLKAGLTCNIRIRNTSAASAVLFPFKAVVEQMGEYFVFVLNGEKVTQRRVDLGARINDMVVARGGLSPGDQIVVDGVQKLRDNVTVAVAGPQVKPATETAAVK
jgi:membrane fusion protein (multidrug efflux system)